MVFVNREVRLLSKYVVTLRSGANCSTVHEKITSFRGYRELSDTSWLICSTYKAEWLRDFLLRSLPKGGEVFVVEAVGQPIHGVG